VVGFGINLGKSEDEEARGPKKAGNYLKINGGGEVIECRVSFDRHFHWKESESEKIETQDLDREDEQEEYDPPPVGLATYNLLPHGGTARIHQLIFASHFPSSLNLGI